MDNNLYLNPNRRHDFVLFFDVTDGNPNGDPDAGNLPRFDPETNYGFVTDVSLKRKIRDYVAMFYNKEIYIQSKFALNTLCYKKMAESGIKFPEIQIDNEEFFLWLINNGLAEECEKENFIRYIAEEDLKTKTKQENIEVPDEYKELIQKLDKDVKDYKKKNKTKIANIQKDNFINQMILQYYDIRMFGAVLTAGTNAGQIRGPLQLTFAKSMSPIFPRDITITRIAVTKESDKRKKDTEMGRKHFIHYGLYRAHGFYNPKLAERLIKVEDGFENPVKDKDLEILWDALQNMFEVHHTSSSGEVRFRGLYIFSHDDETGKGKAHAHELFDLVNTELKNKSNPPRSFDDYYPLPKQNSIVLPEGIQLKTFGV